MGRAQHRRPAASRCAARAWPHPLSGRFSSERLEPNVDSRRSSSSGAAAGIKALWILALFWLKIEPFKSLQTYPILACLLNPLLRARSRPFICIGRSSTPAAETTTSFSWARRHIMARGSSGGERRPWHPRPSSSTYFLPSIACVCCPPAASSARLLLPPAVLTRPPVVLFSLLSLQVLHATVAAAVRSRPALSSISWPRAFERCKQRFKAKNFGACGGPRAIVEAAGWRCRHHRVWLSYRVWGYFSGVRCGWSGRKWSNFFYCRNG